MADEFSTESNFVKKEEENKKTHFNFFKKYKNLNKKGLIVFIAIILIAIFTQCISFFESDNFFDIAETTEDARSLSNLDKISKMKKLFGSKFNFKAFEDSYIAIIHIEGVIEAKNKTYNHKEILKTIEILAEDDNNLAIMLYINSPGGAVYQADELYLALEEYKTSGKKVYAYMGQLAASGGYYVACGASKIIANRNTLTGSIGVISGQYLDASKFLEKMGVSFYVVTSGKNKAMGHFYKPLTDEQKEISQSIADNAYEQFTDIVANSRKLSARKVKKLADGRIYTARQALDLELIDSIATFEKAVEMLEYEEFGGMHLELENFDFSEKDGLYDFLTSISTFTRGVGIFLKTKSIEQAVNECVQTMSYPAYYYQQ